MPQWMICIMNWEPSAQLVWT